MHRFRTVVALVWMGFCRYSPSTLFDMGVFHGCTHSISQHLFLWSNLRKTYTNHPQTINDLKEAIRAKMTRISPKLTQRYDGQLASQFTEFKKIGIEPSLGSWYYVLNTFCKERGPVIWILEDIMVQIENEEHQIQDLNDTFFFITAMDICRNHLQDKELAKRVNKLLHHGNNYDLMEDSFKESIYYRHYFILLCQTEPLDTFIEEIYYKFVPHIYVPEPIVMGEILDVIEINTAVEYLPRIWSYMIVFDNTDRENLLDTILNVMTNNPPENKSDLLEQFAGIGWDIFSRVQNQNENKI